MGDDANNCASRRSVSRRLSNFHVLRQHAAPTATATVTVTAATTTSNTTANAARPKSIAPTPRRMTSHNKLSKDDLAAMYSSTIKLCQDNKINATNTWALDLIDYMPHIFTHPSNPNPNNTQQQPQQQHVRTENDSDNATDFQLAGVTLDAGVKIYCSRVDSVHINAFKVLGGLSHNKSRSGNDDGNDEDNGDDDDDEEGSNKRGGKRTNHTGRATLESNMKNITMQRLETDLDIDPLFDKMSAAFDEGGASGMLINNLSISGDARIVFDSSQPLSVFTSAHTDTQSQSRSRYDISGIDPGRGDESDVLSSSFTQFYNAKMGLSDSTCFAHDEAMEGSEASQWHVTASQQDDQVNMNNMDMNIDNDHDNDTSIPSFDYDDDDMMNDDSISTSASVFPSVRDVDNGDHEHDGEDEDDVTLFATAPDQELRDDDGLELVAGAYALARRAWAGPQHWRPGGAAVTTSGTGIETRGQVGKKGSKKSQLLNFSSDAPAIDFEREFRAAKTARSISLATQRAAVATLPRDLHIGTEWLCGLFLRAGSVVRGKKKEEIRKEDKEVETGWCDYDDDGFGDDVQAPLVIDEEGDAIGNEGVNEDGDEGLMEAPQKVQAMDIAFARVAKKVDVRTLKAGLWDCLSHPRPPDKVMTEEEEVEKEETMKLQNVVKKLDAFVEQEAMTDVSVPYVFICLLHLANEKGLEITSADDGNDAIISMHSASRSPSSSS